MQKEWVTAVRDQCATAGVPFFFKQWGGVRKHKTGRRLEGRIHSHFPQVITSSLPDERHRLAALDEVEESTKDGWFPILALA